MGIESGPDFIPAAQSQQYGHGALHKEAEQCHQPLTELGNWKPKIRLRLLRFVFRFLIFFAFRFLAM
jgi:hypothetical protein